MVNDKNEVETRGEGRTARRTTSVWSPRGPAPGEWLIVGVLQRARPGSRSPPSASQEPRLRPRREPSGPGRSAARGLRTGAMLARFSSTRPSDPRSSHRDHPDRRRRLPDGLPIAQYPEVVPPRSSRSRRPTRPPRAQVVAETVAVADRARGERRAGHDLHARQHVRRRARCTLNVTFLDSAPTSTSPGAHAEPRRIAEAEAPRGGGRAGRDDGPRVVERYRRSLAAPKTAETATDTTTCSTRQLPHHPA